MSRIQHPTQNVLRTNDAAKYIGVAKSTFLRWVQAGRLPKGVRLSARATIWMVSDLDKFLQAAADRGGLK